MDTETSLGYVRARLKANGASRMLGGTFSDVTGLFSGTRSRLLATRMDEGNHVFALKLPLCAGIFGKKGPETKFFGEVLVEGETVGSLGGNGKFLTSDELPAYGIGRRETRALRERLGLGELDLAIVVANTRENAEGLIEFVIEKLNHLIG